jgi:serine/threonine-protein kinase RsbT
VTAPVLESRVVTVVDEADRVWCAEMARGFGERAGLSVRARWELAIAVSELVSNVVKYARRGELELRRRAGPRPAVEIEVRDHGPGIPDAERAFVDGFSGPVAPGAPPRGLGTGLGAVRRLMSELEVRSVPGEGTVIRAAKCG